MVRNVLSIGKNRPMNFLIKTVLDKIYKLVLVEDVFVGMHFLKHNRDINLVIIDIDYQTRESIAFIRHINSSKLFHKPIIVLSSNETKKAHDTAIDEGIHAYFVKPFNPIELTTSIKELNNSLALSPSLS